MLSEEELNNIKETKKKWEQEILSPALKRFNIKESTNKYYSPLDVKDFNYLEKVGLPGNYPCNRSAVQGSKVSGFG